MTRPLVLVPVADAAYDGAGASILGIGRRVKSMAIAQSSLIGGGFQVRVTSVVTVAQPDLTVVVHE
ncbi:hypothetical protein GII30_01140 [Gordonia amarae]|uniref:Uncharacterized protein n=1 Tax=Gordonia amarae TaxID=36821 RepID=A0A857KSY8_9ACTN|nr:hypothetical protein [Gordonia amarae]MCS3876948.1 hypothetical protein [Gordonia amarae]QHN15773.1 hypothetical protein GII35_01140 [Gordonia amarae]QHN20342.1 hypothetical protein GII34_01140 [Gordonia amarae]QHN29193.1 hypothetical protein GII32_01145 [Gordonia amarae]QHN37972.1 hypothetical protein GII30_01140 [Gordonia amarae]